MKTVRTLYHRLQSTDFATAYPEYDPDDGKIHVLYVAPFLNGSGYYRMILPALELNRTDTHAALVTSLRKWDFTKSFDELDHRIDPDLIRWADYLVFPAMYADVQHHPTEPPFFDALRALHSGVQLVMDLDSNFFHLPETHPGYQALNDPRHPLGDLAARQTNLLNNLAAMDVVIGASETLLDEVDQRLEKYHPQADPRLEYAPNLLSPYSYEHLGTLRQHRSPLVRVGLIGNYSTHYDLLTIREVLHALQQQYDDRMELYVFGWNGKKTDGEQAFGDLRFTPIKSVSFMDETIKGRLKRGYFSTLYDLQLDLALLPMADIPFNTRGKSAIKYLELSAFQVPVVAANHLPYQEVIQDGVTGYLTAGKDEWVAKAGQLLTNARLRKEMGQRAARNAWKHHSYTRHLEVLQDLFL